MLFLFIFHELCAQTHDVYRACNMGTCMISDYNDQRPLSTVPYVRIQCALWQGRGNEYRERIVWNESRPRQNAVLENGHSQTQNLTPQVDDCRECKSSSGLRPTETDKDFLTD